MHTKLKDRYALVRNLDFPGKRLVTALSGSFVDTRRTALEKYMQVWLFSYNPCHDGFTKFSRILCPYLQPARARNSERSSRGTPLSWRRNRGPRLRKARLHFRVKA